MPEVTLTDFVHPETGEVAVINAWLGRTNLGGAVKVTTSKHDPHCWAISFGDGPVVRVRSEEKAREALIFYGGRFK